MWGVHFTFQNSKELFDKRLLLGPEDQGQIRSLALTHKLSHTLKHKLMLLSVNYEIGVLSVAGRSKMGVKGVANESKS